MVISNDFEVPKLPTSVLSIDEANFFFEVHYFGFSTNASISNLLFLGEKNPNLSKIKALKNMRKNV